MSWNHRRPLPPLTSTETRRLETKLEKDIRWANTLGSLDRLVEVVSISEREKCAISHKLRLDALKMFCSKLSPVRERLIEAVSVTRVEHIMLCLEGIMIYSCPDYTLDDRDERFKAKVGSLIARSWENILRWIKFLVEVQLESDIYDQERALQIKLRLANFFIAASEYTFHLHDIISSDDALHIIIKLWLEDTEKGVNDLSKMLHASLYRGDMSEERIKFIEETVAQPRQIARIAMTRLRKSIQFKKMNEVYLYLDVVAPFFLEGSPTMLKELVRYHGIPVLMSIADQPADKYPGMLLGKCIHSMAKVLMATTRLLWLKSALDKGFMKHFIKFSTTEWGEEDYPNGEIIRNGVFAVLRSYLVFSPAPSLILKSITECLEDSSYSAALSITFDGGKWSIFEETLLDRFITRQLIHDRHKHKIYSCSNHRCEKSGEGEMFKRCEHCLTTYYCSKSCQRSAWASHKQRCEELGRHRLSIEKVGICYQREQFLYYFACYDIMRHAIGLQKLISDELKDVPQEYHGIRISYSANTSGNVLNVLDSRHVIEVDEIVEEVEDPDTEAIRVFGNVFFQPSPSNSFGSSTDPELLPVSLFIHTGTKDGEDVFLRFSMPRIMLKVDPDARKIASRTFYSGEPPKPMWASYGEVEELVQQVQELSSSQAGEGGILRFGWNEDMIRSVVTRYLETGHQVSEDTFSC